MCQNNTIMVSVCMITYNHEPYIAQAIEGVISQKCNFKFKLIIGEDSSPDKTRSICEAYAIKYPEIIELLPKEANLGMMPNFSRTMNACSGKYIAICEGDDYWTDPLKLQKQVDFLESHPDFSMCFHNVNVLCENEMADDIYDHLESREFTGDEILRRWSVPTCSVLFKSDIKTLVPSHKNFQYGDNVLFATCARHGRLMCINQRMGVYRRANSGAAAQLNNVSSFNHWCAMYDRFEEFRESIIYNLGESGAGSIKALIKMGRFFSAIKVFTVASRKVGIGRFWGRVIYWTFGCLGKC